MSAASTGIASTITEDTVSNGQGRPPWPPQGNPARAVAPPAKPIGPLGMLAIAVGVGVFGYYVLDGHSHECTSCGNRWRHLGAFNFGDATAHKCRECGTIQWWKDGFQHVFRDPSRDSPSLVPPPPPQQWPQQPQAQPPTREELPPAVYAPRPTYPQPQRVFPQAQPALPSQAQPALPSQAQPALPSQAQLALPSQVQAQPALPQARQEIRALPSQEVPSGPLAALMRGVRGFLL